MTDRYLDPAGTPATRPARSELTKATRSLHDAIDAATEQVGKPRSQCGLVQECRHLRADPFHSGRYRTNQLPGFQWLQSRLHLRGPIRILLDHPRNHQVCNPVTDPGLGR